MEQYAPFRETLLATDRPLHQVTAPANQREEVTAPAHQGEEVTAPANQRD